MERAIRTGKGGRVKAGAVPSLTRSAWQPLSPPADPPPDDAPKAAICRDLLDMAGEGRSTGFVAAQVLAEAHHMFTRKLGLTREQAALRLRDLVLGIDVLPTTAALLADAFALAARHRLQTFDAIILAAAAEARCDVFYSEDMQHGFGWRGVAVVDPFR